ncbi:hypothetical protein YC2023_016152 [Brassica napus]
MSQLIRLQLIVISTSQSKLDKHHHSTILKETSRKVQGGFAAEYMELQFVSQSHMMKPLQIEQLMDRQVVNL